LNLIQPTKTLELKTPGFLFLQTTMTPIDIKKQFRKIKWTTEHTLTPDQVKKLIQKKLERAQQLHQHQTQEHNKLLD
jgi:hypothetical protein